ncbi:MAG: hypothetical protein ABWY63_07180 [Hyphomicrobiaceae bacterium]|jgi:hypothetical protein
MYRTAIALVCLLTASAAIAQPGPPKKSDGRRTIGVISAMGEKFSVQKIGIMVFGNDLQEASISSWGIDDLVASKIGSLLGKQFNVTRIAAPKAAFDSIEQPGGLFRDREEEQREIVRKITAAHKNDLYIVVTRGGSPYSNTNQVLTGLGILEAGAPIYSDNVYLFALSVITVYDGRTFKLIKRQAGSIGQSTFLTVVKGPHQKVDKSWWAAAPQVAQSEKLRNATRALVEQSIAQTVPEIVGAR